MSSATTRIASQALRWPKVKGPRYHPSRRTRPYPDAPARRPGRSRGWPSACGGDRVGRTCQATPWLRGWQRRWPSRAELSGGGRDCGCPSTGRQRPVLRSTALPRTNRERRRLVSVDRSTDQSRSGRPLVGRRSRRTGRIGRADQPFLGGSDPGADSPRPRPRRRSATVPVDVAKQPMPDRPASRADQNSSTSRPMARIDAQAVTTTRCFGIGITSAIRRNGSTAAPIRRRLETTSMV